MKEKEQPKIPEVKYPIVNKLNKEIGEANYTEEAKQSLIDALAKQSDAYAQEALKKKRERENEKIKFLGGAELSLNEIKNLVAAYVQGYDPMFPHEIPFYKQIYRLNKWDHLDPKDFIKPPCVAEWTLDLIYRRFPKEVLPAIQVLNSQVMGFIRLYKNFQFLTSEGRLKAIQFRDEAITEMEGCTTWHEFRLNMWTKHKVPYVYQIPAL